MRIAQKFDGTLSNIAPSGYSVVHDPKKCRTCRKCSNVCIFNAITFTPDNKRIYDKAVCMGCGLCVEKCEQKALSLVRDASKGDPLDLDFVRETLGAGGNRIN